MLLGLRAPNTDEPGTWSTIGGCLNRGENAFAAAIRECREEIGINAEECLEPTAIIVDDHGGWSYTTILATPTRDITDRDFRLDNNEIYEIRWVTRRDLPGMEVHSAFKASTLDELRFLLPPNIQSDGTLTEWGFESPEVSKR
ncbi:NUDIX hydrolase domain-like protein [Hypoxylon crocopeplum]|nr:NUDIX hydrolase domain-like protein [Hypoxylon crocopeplum]